MLRLVLLALIPGARSDLPPLRVVGSAAAAWIGPTMRFGELA